MFGFFTFIFFTTFFLSQQFAKLLSKQGGKSFFNFTN